MDINVNIFNDADDDGDLEDVLMGASAPNYPLQFINNVTENKMLQEEHT